MGKKNKQHKSEEAPAPVFEPGGDSSDVNVIAKPFSTSDLAVVQKLSANKIYPCAGTGSPMVHTYRIDDAEKIQKILSEA